MPDFTIEYAWRCADCFYPPWEIDNPDYKPKCDWNKWDNGQGLDVVMRDGEAFCPKCGQVAVSEKYAV